MESVTIGRSCFIMMKMIEIHGCRSLHSFNYAKTTLKPSICSIDPCLQDTVFSSVQKWIHLDYY